MLNSILVMLIGFAASLSLLAALLKANALRKERRKIVTITMGDEKIDIEASESDVKSLVHRLQDRSPALR